MHSLFVVKLYPWFVYVCSQPGPGTVCCGSRSWASTTWKFCQLICPMTPCMSARRQMLPWGPEGPNSLSSVCLCASVSLHMTMGCTRDGVWFYLRSFSAAVPPDDPVIDGGPEVLLNARESYNLSCVSRGAKPPSMIKWLKDGLPVEGANNITVNLKRQTHTWA